MSQFKLSQRSLDRLQGVDDRMVSVVKMAITLSKVDFGVVQGLRTLDMQKELVAKGASQTMKSKHLDGLAVDLMAYVSGRACWEIWALDVLHVILDGYARHFRIFDTLFKYCSNMQSDCSSNFIDVVRRDSCCHPDSNTVASIQE